MIPAIQVGMWTLVSRRTIRPHRIWIGGSTCNQKGRALLMLFLFSDVGEPDAPTRIRNGSHLRVARLLAPAGRDGLSFMEVARALDGITSDLAETTATGPAGTVYLCHPFLAHAAQRHAGSNPRFMAQPPLYSKAPFDLARSDENFSLVEKAIITRIALAA